MATWDEVRAYLTWSFEDGGPDGMVLRDETHGPDHLALRINLPGGRSQKVGLRCLRVDGDEWLEIATIVSWENEIDAREALIGTPLHLGVTPGARAPSLLPPSGADLTGLQGPCGAATPRDCVGSRGRAGLSSGAGALPGAANGSPLSPYRTWAEHRAGRPGCHRAKRGQVSQRP
jgi:hypothetical protein